MASMAMQQRVVCQEPQSNPCASTQLQLITPLCRLPTIARSVFRYSGKVLSHHQLEETNEKLRRRLANTLVNVTNPLRYGSGGLLDNEFVCLRCVGSTVSHSRLGHRTVLVQLHGVT